MKLQTWDNFGHKCDKSLIKNLNRNSSFIEVLMI